MPSSHTLYYVCVCVCCSDETFEKEDGADSPCTTPDIIRERRPSSYHKKRRTIYTAGECRCNVECGGVLGCVEAF